MIRVRAGSSCRHVCSLEWGALTFLLSLLTACAGAPPVVPGPVPSRSYVVLLKNADGSVGQVRVSTSSGSTELSKAQQATRLGGPAGVTFEASQEQLDKDFGRAAAAIPKKPVSFLLYFVAGGARLNPESEADIPKIMDAITSRDTVDVSIIGHTDTAGDADANEKLGLERARFVAGLLAGGKVDADRVVIESHGEKNLLIATPDNTDEPRNRRVEVPIR